MITLIVCGDFLGRFYVKFHFIFQKKSLFFVLIPATAEKNEKKKKVVLCGTFPILHNDNVSFLSPFFMIFFVSIWGGMTVRGRGGCDATLSLSLSENCLAHRTSPVANTMFDEDCSP